MGSAKYAKKAKFSKILFSTQTYVEEKQNGWS